MAQAERRSELDRTMDLQVPSMDDESKATQIAAAIVTDKDSPCRKLTEEEFFAEVDEALAEADAGLIAAEIAAEFGLEDYDSKV